MTKAKTTKAKAAKASKPAPVKAKAALIVRIPYLLPTYVEVDVANDRIERVVPGDDDAYLDYRAALLDSNGRTLDPESAEAYAAFRVAEEAKPWAGRWQTP